MDVFEAIATRRSIRRYTEEQVTDDEIGILIKAAQDAPSAGNLQARDFIIVRDPLIKKKLGDVSLGQPQIYNADVVICVCANIPRSASRYGTRGKLYSIQDATASIENMLLAAHALGLGCCWVGAFDDDEVSRILGLPEGVLPVALITVGRPAEKPQKPPRFTTENVHWERW